jgi:Putative zinc-finger
MIEGTSPMECGETNWLLVAWIHGELDEDAGQRLAGHLEQCPRCLRLSRLERGFEARLQAVPPTAASPELRARIQAAVQSQALRDRPRFPRLVRAARPVGWLLSGVAAASLLFAVWPGGGLDRSPAGELEDRVGTMVCLACFLRPETMPQHQAGRGQDHVNVVRDSDGALWHLVVAPEHRAWLVDDGLLQKTVQVRGLVFAKARTIWAQDLTEIGTDTSWQSSQGGVDLYGALLGRDPMLVSGRAEASRLHCHSTATRRRPPLCREDVPRPRVGVRPQTIEVARPPGPPSDGRSAPWFEIG